MDQVRQTGLEIDSGDEQGKFAARVAALQKKGAQARNDSKSIYVKRISSAC